MASSCALKTSNELKRIPIIQAFQAKQYFNAGKGTVVAGISLLACTICVLGSRQGACSMQQTSNRELRDEP